MGSATGRDPMNAIDSIRGIPFSGAVLAGGKSSRMGRDKALVGVGGKTLLSLQLDRLRLAGASEFLVSVARDAALSTMPGWDPRVRWIEDPVPDAGPMAGVEAVLRAAIAGHVLVLAVDLPAVDVAFLSALVSRAAPGVGVVPRCNGRWEPLCAVYPSEPALGAAAAMAAGGKRAVRDLVDQGIAAGWMRPWEVPESEVGKLANWNRPEDWSAG